MKRSFLILALCSSAALLQAAPISFPPGLIPFNSIANQTAKDPSGNTLVLGFTNVALLNALNSLPYPTMPNQTFSDLSIQLAPGAFFSSVFVPTPAQRAGVYSAFPEPLIDPLTGKHFSGNFIPTSRFLGDNGLFAFEVGPSNSAVPEPAELNLILGVAFLFALIAAIRRRRTSEPV